MRLENCLKNAITPVLMCNTSQISSLLAERIETNYSLPPTLLIFYLCGDEDTQLRGAVPGDGEQRDATRRFPFSPSSLPRIKSCHHHFSFVIKDCLSASDGHLQLLMSANMEMIRRILTVTNFKCIVSCYQWVTVMTDNVHAFICREQKRRKHRTI